MQKKKLILALLGVALLCWSCSSFWKNLQTVSDGYQKRFNYQGVLEKKYAADGEYAVETYSEESDEERIKLFQVYYPAELTTSQKKWPVVIMANGTGIRASKYKAIFRHLASWGFIVAGNEDEWTWDGRSVSMTLDFILSQNQSAESRFHDKVELQAIGLVGHSQGGVAVFNAVGGYDNSRFYKALCSQSCTAPVLADSLKWPYSASSVAAPMLLMAGTGAADAKLICPLESMEANFDAIEGQPVVMARLKGIDHGDVIKRGDAYMTAWMRYWLCNDKEAAGCFVGNNAEILSNPDWQDVERKGL